MTEDQFDAIVVGSGINALVAGAILAKAGWRVCLCERNASPGGAIATRDDVIAGYNVELLSSWYPLFLGGPAYALLADELAARGVRFENTVMPTGVVCRDGSAILSTDPAITAEQLGRLGDADNWAAMMAGFTPRMDLAFGLLGTDFWRRSGLGFGYRAWRRLGTRGLTASGAELLEPAAPWLERTFDSPVTRALLAPWALHNGLGPDDASSAFITKVIAAAIAMGGCPVPIGGGVTVVNALAGIISDAGGEVRTGADVIRVDVAGGRAQGVTLAGGSSLRARRAVLASVTPQALYSRLLADADVRPATRTAAENFRYGRAGMQIHIALREQPAWSSDASMADVAMVHLLDDMDSLSESVNAANRGYLPRRPTIVVGQPCTMDPSRAPEGASLLWIQLQENPRRIKGDLGGEIDGGDGSWTPAVRDAYAERILTMLEQHISNVRSAAVQTVILGPADLEQMNANLVGGDPYSGDCRVDQYAAWRPLSTAQGFSTGVRNLWQIGASTHPGPGLGGGSGYLVAQRLLGR